MMDVIIPTRVPKPCIHYDKKTIHGSFRVFRIMRDQSLIFILDHPEYEDLDCKLITLKGKDNDFYCKLRYVGFVSGELKSDIPIYRITEPHTIMRVTAKKKI